MQQNFASIHGSYGYLEIAIFENERCIDVFSQEGLKASSNIIPLFSSLLSKHYLSLNDLNFIAVDCGPGAFTSLRVVIATVNGLGFASQVPLIGVSGLQALCEQSLISFKKSAFQSKIDAVVCLLNAYNNDVYCLVKKFEAVGAGHEQCKKIDVFLEELQLDMPNKNILFSGNGASMHKILIESKFGQMASFLNPITQTCSAVQVGMIAWQLWVKRENITDKIVPNYLKTQTFAIKK
jgi:tRNA threonylcarbamoyladenosine biosynthesis protein TsaB